MELDLLPSQLRRELEKSYNQVPPINRILVRKLIQNAFDRPPEEVFQSFEPDAFAAASLGQVHRARTMDGREIAVKVQYPGIRTTIVNDIQLIKNLLRPLDEYEMMVTALKEIEERLLEEIDYCREAEHAAFFARNLRCKGFRVPEVHPQWSTDTILSTGLAPGQPLNEWTRTEQDQERRDIVAQALQDMFLHSLYELHCIHADPNPGNFIVDRDLNISLIDFGCVKRLEKGFVKNYAKLAGVAAAGDQVSYMQVLKSMNVLKSRMDSKTEAEIGRLLYPISCWFGRLFEKETFDFKANQNFFQEARELTKPLYRYRKHADINPHFIFLDRTRYGLLRIFEQLGARVKFRNPYEWEKG